MASVREDLAHRESNITTYALENISDTDSTFNLDDNEFLPSSNASVLSVTNSISHGEGRKTHKGTIHSLELYNFKSYYGTVTISPFTTFNAIIGPNGSGKSNLMDAISFVLCIKVSSLRGANLKDLISRKSKHSTNRHAYVSLKLCDNDGFSTFKRIINSDDAISYVYNDKVVSFREYIDALGDYRINTLGSSGLIFQDAVNDILLRSPSELTRIFETISGSNLYEKPYNVIKRKLDTLRAEYKEYISRKKQSQQEVKHCSSIISTNKKYDSQLNDYKEKEARKYACRYMILLHKFNSTNSKYKPLSDEYKLLNNKMAAVNDKKNELEDNRLALYYNQSKLNRLIRHKSMELIEHKELALKFFDKKLAVQRKNEQLESMRTSLYNDVNALKAHYDEIKRCESELKADIDTCVKDMDIIRNEICSLPHVQKDEFDTLLQEFHKTSASMKIKMNMLKTNIEDKSAELQQAKNKLNALQRMYNQSKDDLSRNDELLNGMKNKLRETNDSLELLAMQLEHLTFESTDLDKSINVLKTEKETCEADIRSLNLAKGEYAKIFKRTEFTNELTNKIPGVYGEVLSLFGVNNSRYRQGVMSALNTRAQTIVTDIYATVPKCIEIMNKNKVGRRDFIPLELISNNDKSRTRRQIADLMKSLSNIEYVFGIDCIDFDSEYKSLFEYLLGDTIIVPTIDDAERIIKYKNRRNITLSFFIVTQKGQLITRDRTIVITSIISKNTQSELEVAEYNKRASRIKSIEEEILLLSKRKVSNDESLQESLRKRDRCSRGAEMLKFKIEFAEKQKKACKLKINGISSDITVLSEEIKKYEKLLNEYNKELDNENNVMQNLQRTYFADLSLKTGINDIYNYVMDRYEQLERLKITHTTKKTTQKRYVNEMDEIQKKINDISTKKIPDIDVELKSSGDLLSKLFDENKIMHKKLERLESEIQDSKKSLNENLKLIEECNKNISSVPTSRSSDTTLVVPESDSRDSLFKELCLLETNMKKLQEEAIKLAEECHVQNVNCFIVTPSSLINNASLKFVSEFPVLQNEQDFLGLPDDPYELEVHIAALDNSLEELKVSLSNNGDYFDAQSKLEETNREIERLDRSMAKVKEQIIKLERDFEKIRKERTGLFLHCFNTVKQYVGQIYRKLSSTDDSFINGGQAFLSIDDDLSKGNIEPFHCNIRYNTMPPMKKYLDINLQSGGEKALSSVALLLALHNFRETPFIILDEVDANIDSVKLKGLTNYLKSCKTQVIIISLKDKVFSKADNLIGVYREQPNSVSRCITLNLTDYKEDSDDEY